jgi:hypothetical protein
MKKLLILSIAAFMFSSSLFANSDESNEIANEIQTLVASDDSDSEPYSDDEPQPGDDQPSEEEENPEL